MTKKKTTKKSSGKKVSKSGGAAASPDSTSPDKFEQELLNALEKSIESFNKNRVAILKKAFDEGGDDLVSKLEQEHEDLRAAHFEVLRRQLDRNNGRYEELLKEATAEAAAVEKSIAKLERVTKVLNAMTQAVSVVGRALIVLGV